jgi:3alpha(or 20beta)-hydroxysteroid dehydrogenase
MRRLSGKIILISGAARGQGAAEATLCVAEGATVHMIDIRDSEGESLAARLCAESEGRAHYHHLDVASEEGWVKVTADIQARHGHLDDLVNNAGIFLGSPLEATELSDWNHGASGDCGD